MHHIALAVVDLDNAMSDVSRLGVPFETSRVETGLDDGKRCLLSTEATNGIKTY